jgi:hypothetical protein
MLQCCCNGPAAPPSTEAALTPVLVLFGRRPLIADEQPAQGRTTLVKSWRGKRRPLSSAVGIAE